MNQNLVIGIVVLIVAIAALFLLTRGKKDNSTAPVERSTPAPIADHEGNDVVASAAAAVEDVAGQFVGIDMHPDLNGPADDLTRIKGLGPKAAAQLKLLGVTRYAQIAALDTAQIAALDQQMGVFRGRLERDRWAEQARYLSRGDTVSFEKEFGKLG